MLTSVRQFEFELCPDKSLYWPEKKILMVADLHLGKINHFRRSGYPVPAKANEANTGILIDLINSHRPDRVIFLGDLFHSHYNQEWEVMGQVVRHFSNCSFELVMGNHDIMSSLQYERHGMIMHQGLELDGLWLTHVPDEKTPARLYNLAGHVHPGAKLYGMGKQALVLPCFHFGEQHGILPAFGEFTGLHPVRPRRNDRVFVIAEGSILEVSDGLPVQQRETSSQ
jgi:uncharacterized protein